MWHVDYRPGEAWVPGDREAPMRRVSAAHHAALWLYVALVLAAVFLLLSGLA
jgi:hypothetical protein